MKNPGKAPDKAEQRRKRQARALRRNLNKRKQQAAVRAKEKCAAK